MKAVQGQWVTVSHCSRVTLGSVVLAYFNNLLGWIVCRWLSRCAHNGRGHLKCECFLVKKKKCCNFVCVGCVYNPPEILVVDMCLKSWMECYQFECVTDWWYVLVFCLLDSLGICVCFRSLLSSLLQIRMQAQGNLIQGSMIGNFINIYQQEGTRGLWKVSIISTVSKSHMQVTHINMHRHNVYSMYSQTYIPVNPHSSSVLLCLKMYTGYFLSVCDWHVYSC